MNPPPKNAVPTLIAHRGAPARFPENTIIGYQAAVAAGAKFVELDVQLTRDLVPILHHDQDLKRMTGHTGIVTEMNSADVLKHFASHPEKFKDQFANNPLSTLSEFADWFANHPNVTAFVEIKRESVEAIGAESTAKIVLEAIEPILDHAVVISFHEQVITSARKLSAAAARPIPIGWVLPAYDESNHDVANRIRAEYLFCNTTRIPKDRRVWESDSQWVLYNTDSVTDALDYFKSGFEMLETNRIVDLLGSPEFSDE